MKLKSRAYIAIAVVVAVLIGAFVIYKEGVLPPDKNDETSRIFVIPLGESLPSIVDNLEKENFIRNKIVFFLLVKQLGIEKKIQAGDYRLSSSMDAYEIANQLTHGTLDVWVTIKEGLRNEEVAEELSKNLGLTEAELTAAMEAKEGYLFPDTYLIPKQSSPEAAIAFLANNFEVKYQEVIAKADRSNGFTRQEIVTIASLIEREARYAEDRPKVADVIARRLSEGMKLQIDATVQYALGYDAREKSWWKRELSFDDLEIDSPYNTYQVTGLPPAPIANPGISSLEAAANADPDSPYLFYVSDSEGHLHFAEDDEGHLENQRKYLQ